jgi:circadian clock protein KaiB
MHPREKDEVAVNAIEGSAVAGLEEALRAQREAPYALRLYVSGITPLSVRAITHTKRICDSYLAGRYDLRIVDVYQHPEAARAFSLVAAPTLVREWPLPVRVLIGDMSNTPAVLAALDLVPEGEKR